MNYSSPAVTARTDINPRLLELVQDDPSVLVQLSRSMLLVEIDKLRQYDLTVPQRLQFTELLAKLGDAYPKAGVQQQGHGTGFSVHIVMSAPTDTKPAPVTIDLPPPATDE